MDSITHIALGACIGDLFVGGKVGRKAMLWGALAQSFPDIDFVTAFYMGTTDELLAHRGFTHSLLFAALLTPVLSLLAEKWHRPHNISLAKVGVVGSNPIARSRFCVTRRNESVNP